MDQTDPQFATLCLKPRTEPPKGQAICTVVLPHQTVACKQIEVRLSSADWAGTQRIHAIYYLFLQTKASYSSRSWRLPCVYPVWLRTPTHLGARARGQLFHSKSWRRQAVITLWIDLMKDQISGVSSPSEDNLLSLISNTNQGNVR